MPILNVEENIKKISESIAAATQEVLRMEGALRVFQGFKEGGLEEVDIPNVPEGATPVDAQTPTIPEEPEAEEEVTETN
jgi:hypothetical protein|tara:strand:+ start:2144 stop:2380 length:237 start_codon:yes stop_codon:yes gene_type:complete